MAFVFRAERKLGPQKTTTKETVGPGSYFDANKSSVQVKKLST
jgi:hypothetical protein